jgi:RNA polymerase sigma factor (sigma-70 family)
MRIQRAISRLPERQRRVFLLKELAGFQQTEISRMLGMPDGTVKSLMHRAVKRLRLELSDRYSQPVEGSVNKCRVKTLSV